MVADVEGDPFFDLLKMIPLLEGNGGKRAAGDLRVDDIQLQVILPDHL